VGDRQAGALNDIIFAYAGKDQLQGLKGNDTLAGGAGADRFIYRAASSGHDVIRDFAPTGGDVVEISKAASGVKLFSNLYRNVRDNASGDAVLKLADGGTITFDGIRKAQLGYDDFLLV
jgi:Ca2+-binding RTX toxin-like protein